MMKKLLTLFLALSVLCLTNLLAQADYAYYVPYYTSKDDSNTGIGVRNCSTTQAANVTIIVYDHDGTQRLVERISVPARGQTAYTVGKDLDVEGSMRVTSDQPLAGLVLVFMGGLTYGADIPFTQELSDTIFNPHVASSARWNTTIVLNNPQNSTTSVALTYIDQSGQATPLTTSDITANGIATYKLSNFLGAGVSFKGSVEVTANQGVAGLVFYSNREFGGSYYSGITAMDPAKQLENYVPTQFAVVATVAPDFASGAHSVIPVDEPRIAQNNLLPTLTSDITVAAYGKYFFRIERFMADNVTKFDINDPDTVIWQYSTLGDEPVASNPYDMIFVNDAKAYLLRYETTKAWIVNPSATTEAAFKIGELDLSSYADSDGIPEMAAGVIAGNKLFIVLQRINRDAGWVPTNTPYVAVFETATDTEIDTASGGDGVAGIPLDIANPLSIHYMPDKDMIYVQGAGKYEDTWNDIPAEYSGGILRIDPDTYETVMVVDDGDETTHPYGNISGMVVVSATKGYFSGYAGWGDNTVYAFNPSTGAVTDPVSPYLSGKNISGVESGVYADKNGMVWICNQTDAEVVLLNSANDAIEGTISTDLNPLKVVFCEP